jgi:putative transposase
MPIKRPKIINDEIYHLIIRATGDTEIFKSEADYFRAIFSLYEFNNTQMVTIRDVRLLRRKQIVREPFSGNLKKKREREPLLELMAFCLMPNHIHLLTKQIRQSGIVDFTRKFGAGFAGFFNRKYSRKGPLFSKYRAVHIKDGKQLKTAFVYIHANPISLIEPKWKEGAVKNFDKAVEFLEQYRWSSFLDYTGNSNFPSLIKKEFLISAMGGEKKCREYLFDWLRFKSTENRSLANYG